MILEDIITVLVIVIVIVLVLDPSTVTDLDGEKTVSDAGATKVSVGSRFGEQDLPRFLKPKSGVVRNVLLVKKSFLK